MKHMEPVRLSIQLEVTEDRVVVEVQNPVLEHLVIELIEPKFLVVVVVERQIDLRLVYCNATEPNPVSHGHEPFDQFQVESATRRSDFSPLEFASHTVLVAQAVNCMLHLVTGGGGQPETSDHQVPCIASLRAEDIWTTFVAIDIKIHGSPFLCPQKMAQLEQYQSLLQIARCGKLLLQQDHLPIGSALHDYDETPLFQYWRTLN